MSIKTIKEAIKTNLDELVTATTLAGATITDLKKDPLEVQLKNYPHAFLMPPSLESDALDNRSNVRAYVFDIMVLYKVANLASTTALEESIEAIINKFDNDPTLSGTALGGIQPVSSAPQPFQHKNQEMIMVVFQIKAKEFVTLSY